MAARLTLLGALATLLLAGCGAGTDPKAEAAKAPPAAGAPKTKLAEDFQ